MKNYLCLNLAVFMLSALEARAHCPATLKEERVCFMLEKNLLYTYDSKLEHNGPYKDLEKASLLEVKDSNNGQLKFSRIARGVFKIDSPQTQKSIIAVFLNGKNKKEVKIRHD
jgi:hypothetical protein